MPNEMDVHEIISRLKEDHETELVQYELEQMLERELTKPASDIDTALVEEILKTLEEGPSEEEKQSTRAAIERKLAREKGRTRSTVLHRIAACFLAVVVLSAVSIGSAYAFNWKFLLKFLVPVAESFGIYSANTIHQPEAEKSETLYVDEDTGIEQTTYNSIEEMPDEWKGFRVHPAWMPERFVFLQGAGYEDESTAVFSATYTAENAFFNLTTNFFYDDADVSAYEYHMTPDDPITEVIAHTEVTYYLNSDTNRLSASWIDRNVHYSIFGDITEEEMKTIILGIVES